MPLKSAVRAAMMAAALAACPSFAPAATRTDLQRLDARQVGRDYATASARTAKAATVSQRHAELLDMDAEATLSLVRVSRDHAGSHFRYQQTFRGVPVFGESLVISEDLQGNARAFFGNLVQGVAADVPTIRANIPASHALVVAKRAALGRQMARYAIEDATSVKHIHVDDQGRARLVYVVTFFADIPGKGQPTQPTVIVDAMTGRVIKRWESLASALVGTGPGGNLKSGTYEFGVDLGFLDVARKDGVCTLRNSRVRTINLNHATSGSTVHSYTCPRNLVKPINGAMAPMNDAHFFATATYAMYNAYIGTPPLAGRVDMRIHYGNSSNKAAWRSAAKAVLLGDGGAKYHPWVSMDIVGHEIGHGFTDENAGLVRGTAQSAGIDEAFSDISGEATEFFISGTNDFEVGRDVVKAAGSIRYMHNPALDGKSIGHASNYTATMDPHYSSGVYNKAFHALATSPGWDTRKAFQAFAGANRNYWTGNITFNQGACGVEQAAVDLGYAGPDVVAAFSSVGVSCGMHWDVPSAIGLHSGATPGFRNAKRTVDSPAEPADGMYGFAARATVARSSGKRYLEFSFDRQRSSVAFPYSGQTCMSLRRQDLPVEGDAGFIGDWSLCWFADADSSPAATNGPWFRAGGQVLWTHYSGPLGAWRISEGDTIGVAADLDSGKLWFSINGSWVGDPASGAAADFDQQVYGASTVLSGNTVVPQLYSEFQDLTVTLRGSTAELQHPVPAGFTAWGD